jgi:large subunit ribosomal protein L10
MLTKEQKQQQFEQLRDDLSSVTTLFLMQNHGLNVNQVNELRNKVRESDAFYKVYKNSVVKLAVEGTSLEPLGEHLQGPNAIAFTNGDGVALAKVLKEFAKAHPAFSFRKGFLEGQMLDAEEAVKLAELPSKDELIQRLVCLLQSPIRRLAVALNAPVQQLASAVKQIADKAEE